MQMHAERFLLKKWLWKIKKMRTISCKFTDVLIKYIAVIPALQSRAVSPGGGGARMRDYELLYIIKTEVSEEQNQAVIDRYNGVLESEGAEVVKVDKWGKRKLAYTIDKKYTDGFYVLVTFKGEANAVNEVDRLMKIDESLIRHMITRVGE